MNTLRRPLLTAVLWIAALGGCTSSAPYASSPVLSQEQIAAILASPDRSAADQTNDKRRKPADMLAFIGIRPGMVALDVSAAGGYTTELIARSVGPTGKVFGQSPPPRAANPAVTPEGNANPSAAPTPPPAAPPVRRSSPQALAERAKNPAASNISAVVQPFENPVPADAAGRLDLVTFMFNYHDMGHLGVDRAQMNKAVFAALKPGGIYVIADHSGRPGTGISESGTLHRIEEAFLRKEVEAAGFKLIAEGNFLRNPNDPRDKNTPEPAMPKDEFVLKFQKP